MDYLVTDKGIANYGCFDGPMHFNPEDFRLRDFFGRETTGLRKRMALGAFNYVGIVGEDFLVGIAAVQLGYVATVFGYLFDFKTGDLFECSAKGLSSRLSFPLNPDESAIVFQGSSCQIHLEKSHARGRLTVEASFGNRLHIQGVFPYGFSHKPLRVVNPSCGDPHRFTFTEKCSPLRPESLSVLFDGAALEIDLARTTALYDWSCGYFNRHTNWLWSAMSGVLPDGTAVGANFAALVNESYFPENAFWIDAERFRVACVIFQYDPEDPYAEDWRIFTEDRRVDLRFKPLGERSEKTHLPFLKVNFRQFFGEYSGSLTGEGGQTVQLVRLKGLAEIHLSVW